MLNLATNNTNHVCNIAIFGCIKIKAKFPHYYYAIVYLYTLNDINTKNDVIGNFTCMYIVIVLVTYLMPVKLTSKFVQLRSHSSNVTVRVKNKDNSSTGELE